MWDVIELAYIHGKEMSREYTQEKDKNVWFRNLSVITKSVDNKIKIHKFFIISSYVSGIVKLVVLSIS